MPTITTKDGTTIFYKDWGPKDAQPIVFLHGWPLSSDGWNAQMLFSVRAMIVNDKGRYHSLESTATRAVRRLACRGEVSYC